MHTNGPHRATKSSKLPVFGFCVRLTTLFSVTYGRRQRAIKVPMSHSPRDRPSCVGAIDTRSISEIFEGEHRMKFLKIAVAVGVVALFTSPSLKADSVLFDFNSLAN